MVFWLRKIVWNEFVTIHFLKKQLGNINFRYLSSGFSFRIPSNVPGHKLQKSVDCPAKQWTVMDKSPSNCWVVWKYLQFVKSQPMSIRSFWEFESSKNSRYNEMRISHRLTARIADERVSVSDQRKRRGTRNLRCFMIVPQVPEVPN